MSWSLNLDKITPARARELIPTMSLPQPIKDYVLLSVDGIEAHYPGHNELELRITGFGHVCEGPGSYVPSSATIQVQCAT